MRRRQNSPSLLCLKRRLIWLRNLMKTASSYIGMRKGISQCCLYHYPAALTISYGSSNEPSNEASRLNRPPKASRGVSCRPHLHPPPLDTTVFKSQSSPPHRVKPHRPVDHKARLFGLIRDLPSVARSGYHRRCEDIR